MWDVWEHIHSPIDFIERCIGFLAPNGILALSIPNASGYPARLFRGNWRYVMFTHLSYFTLPYVQHIMSERNMHFLWADHTIKAQSLLQGVASLLPIQFNTERIIRLGRKDESTVNQDQTSQPEFGIKKKANNLNFLTISTQLGHHTSIRVHIWTTVVFKTYFFFKRRHMLSTVDGN